MGQAFTPLACAKFPKAIRYIPINFVKNLRAHIAAMRRGDFCPHPPCIDKKATLRRADAAMRANNKSMRTKQRSNKDAQHKTI
jgi:hypothetical protein